MSAVILDFGPRPELTIRRKLREFWQRADEQAEQARRTNAQLRAYQAWGERRPQDEPPKSAA